MEVSINKNEFLFEVYVNDFGDNYHRGSEEPSTELEKSAKKIRRRYKNINDYMVGLMVYDEYMDKLAKKHGGIEILKIKIRNDMINEFIPAKPRMRNNVINKFLIKNKIILSRTKHLYPDEEIIDKLLLINNDEIQEFKSSKITDKVVLEIIKDGAVTAIPDKKLKSIHNIDLLAEFFESKEKIKQSKQKEYIPKLNELMNGNYFDKIQDTTKQDEVIHYNGRFVTRDTAEELRVYQNLNDMGWNSIKLMKEKGVSKRATKLIKDRENKKRKKKNKKNDNFMTRVVTDNNYNSFEDFQEDMLNFTSGNLGLND